MGLRLWMSALGVAAVAGSALGQTVEFRIVERQGQLAIMSPPGTTATTDAVLNFSVQARVVGGAENVALGNFAFNIRIAGEPESNGTLNYLLTSNADGTYAVNANQTTNGTVGRGGLSAPYSYLAGIGADFNGVFNVSSGTFINTPDQEIGKITGSPTGPGMLLVTDLNGDGNPDTYVGPLPAPSGSVAPLDTAISNWYFGTNGNCVDVYRFKYTVSNTTTGRLLRFEMGFPGGLPPQAQVFTGWRRSNGVWGPDGAMSATASWSGVNIPVAGDVSEVGACCQREACALRQRAACDLAHGQYRGDGVACIPAGSPNACCVGNFDGEGGLAVQDIFEFLGAWFAGDLRADIDQSDTLEVADIFAFITAWMSGC